MKNRTIIKNAHQLCLKKCKHTSLILGDMLASLLELGLDVNRVAEIDVSFCNSDTS